MIPYLIGRVASNLLTCPWALCDDNKGRTKKQAHTTQEGDPGQTPMRSPPKPKNLFFINYFFGLPCKRTRHGKGRMTKITRACGPHLSVGPRPEIFYILPYLPSSQNLLDITNIHLLPPTLHAIPSGAKSSIRQEIPTIHVKESGHPSCLQNLHRGKIVHPSRK